MSSREDLVHLGLQVGDFVALVTSPELTADGFIVSRHLDGKAGVAVALALAKNFSENEAVLPHRTTVMVTITEEVGHGAATVCLRTSPSWFRWTTRCARPDSTPLRTG